MIEREKVIKGLECCIANRHNNCPYKSTDEGIDKVTTCTTYLMQDALALLKEQEPKQVVDMVDFIEGMEIGYCPSCDRAIAHKTNDKTKFCKFCGQAVKWND